MCGIGGVTVAQAKQRITLPEFHQWCQFRAKYGSFHVGMRVDRSVARASAFFAQAITGSKGIKPSDFSPYDAAIEEANEPEVSFMDAVAFMQSVSKKE